MGSCEVSTDFSWIGSKVGIRKSDFQSAASCQPALHNCDRRGFGGNSSSLDYHLLVACGRVWRDADVQLVESNKTRSQAGEANIGADVADGHYWSPDHPGKWLN